MGDGGTPDGVLSAIPEQISAVGAAARQLEQTLRSALSSVSRDVDAVAWTGMSADAYREVWNHCHHDGSRILDSLAALSASLTDSAVGYEQPRNRRDRRLPISYDHAVLGRPG
ncbi:WXG100 family type VII secretion target [Rhodococcus sp. 14-2470-1a]|uniref:WXG100 family type VII secretion target n=1 Tax=Rhodococcus sp. 14-2470-1a TaxID=2023150 RepID=UPI001179ED78